jgi:hypothetical protein
MSLNLQEGDCSLPFALAGAKREKAAQVLPCTAFQAEN